MNENAHFVKVVRGTMPHVKKTLFYRPVFLMRGTLFSSINENDMPTVWGFETVEDALKVVDRLNSADEDARYA